MKLLIINEQQKNRTSKINKELESTEYQTR